ncbi:MAG: mismatch-specific DNA-glycosylase [Bacteroidales bacterium]|nr:mismatch-specific DNA-glycosylase [Bacteroidales bacterium]
MELEDKIRTINNVVAEYFKLNPNVTKVAAKDLMFFFIEAGVFNKNYRDGLPVRKFFRKLDAMNQLSKIPSLLPERKTKNTYWYFVRTLPEQNEITENKHNILVPLPSKKNKQGVLPDLLEYNLDVVFCGTAVGKESAHRKLYYANSNNKFYSILSDVGFTPRKLDPIEYKELLKYNIGLTDIAKDVAGNDDEINNDDYLVDSFIEKIRKYRPKVVCFNGKRAASVFLFGTPRKTRKVEYGWLNETIGGTKLFVAPSTSGSASAHWDISYWHQLKKEM